ncbi:MAG: serpin family protein [Lachnospiraceae bacterium]|nr:serpin family protein [Lachnospiraceae bacterium]
MCIIKQKKAKKIIAMIMAVATLSSCGSSNTSNFGVQPSVTSKSDLKAELANFKETTLTEQEVFAQEKEFSKGINSFTYDIFSKLDNRKNILLSPYSIATAFSMLANGADGKTKQEIMNLFGIKDLDKWNAYTKEYIKRYQKEDTKLLTANSVWFSNQLTLSQRADQEFFAPLSAYYHVDKKTMDLSADTARKEINNWVSENTNGMISSFLEKNLESSILMILLNAVYFEGDWEEEFRKEDTQPLEFYGANKQTQVDMMCKYKKELKYVEKNGIQGVELPYIGKKLVMDIIIPKQNNKTNQQENIRECFNQLSEKEKDEFFKAFDESSTEEISELMIPKFTISYSVDNLKEVLAEMGLNTVFGEEAVFDKIAEGICVDKVTHKSKIKVDEKGTEAAAVTSIMMKETAMLRKDEINFIVKQPFIFVIRDVETGTILFIGDMQDIQK